MRATTTEHSSIERPGLRRLAWGLWVLAILLLGAYLALFVANLSSDLPGAGIELFQTPLFVVVGATAGALVASRRPENPIGWFLLYMAVVLGLQETLEHYAIYSFITQGEPLPLARWAAWLQSWLLLTFFPIPLSVMLMVFPDGHFLSRRWRLFAIVLLVLNGILIVLVALTPGVIRPGCCPVDLGVTNPLGIVGPGSAEGPINAVAAQFVFLLGQFVAFPAALVSMVLRRRRGPAEVRNQTGLVLVVIGLAALSFGIAILVSIAQGTSGRAASPLFNIAITIIAVGLPLAIGLAILRYRLFDIEVVIRKAVVVALLAAFVMLAYVAVVIGIGSAITGSETNPATIVTFAAAAIVAVAFQPLRTRANRLANRLVYGKRATPFEVLAEFSERVAGPQADEMVLDRMAQVVGEAVGAVRSDVWLRVGPEFRDEASWPSDDAARAASIHVSGEELPGIAGMSHVEAVRDGELLLGAIAVRKPPNDPITPGDVRLISHLASQAALVLRNVRLIEELRASRKRLVSAQDQERRRLERNIHDGAQQQLVALSVKLGLVQQLAERDPSKAKEIAAGLQTELQSALDELRDLARGIYPPLLADKGLGAALEAQARRSPMAVAIDAGGLGRYSQDVEAAVYFCCLEALQNVAKYGGASTVSVTLSARDHALTFAVSDDGMGFDTSTTHLGSGLTNMRDRVEALGGMLRIESAPAAGTTITGRIPVGQPVGTAVRSEV